MAVQDGRFGFQRMADPEMQAAKGITKKIERAIRPIREGAGQDDAVPVRRQSGLLHELKHKGNGTVIGHAVIDAFDLQAAVHGHPHIQPAQGIVKGRIFFKRVKIRIDDPAAYGSIETFNAGNNRIAHRLGYSGAERAVCKPPKQTGAGDDQNGLFLWHLETMIV